MFYREHLVFDGLWGPLVSSDPPPNHPENLVTSGCSFAPNGLETVPTPLY